MIWQQLPSYMNPVFINIGNFKIYYYSLMYLLGFFTTYLLIYYLIKKEKLFSFFSIELIEEYFIYGILGILLGGRLGYILFYNLNYYIKNPLLIIWPFENGKYIGIAGMSYHGAILGLIISTLIFCYFKKINFFDISDLIAITSPLGYTFGRIGNFINGELYGKITSLPIGMYFNNELRHPSQLYEAFFEGIILFIILWRLRKTRPFKGFHTFIYIIGYSFFRFFIEFIREPDPQLGYLLFNLTMGQWLSLFFIISSIIAYFYLKRINN